jgi:hypothetical protein
MLPLLTNSRLRAFRACPRKHMLAYTQGYRLVHEPDALVFGTAIHHALEDYWQGRRAGHSPDARLATVLECAERHVVDPFTRAKARAMLIGYVAAWDAIECEVLGVELQFTMPLLNPETGARSRTWQLAGKLDVLVRLADGRVAVIEHKTTREEIEGGSNYRQALTLDGQVSQYFDGADSLAASHGFSHADVVIYDILAKPKLSPLTATPIESRKYTKAGALYANQRENDETVEEYEARVSAAIAENPAAYYQRAEVVRLESERDEYAFDVWQLGESIRHSERTGKAPRNPDACHRYGRPCEFWGVCTGQQSLDDTTRFRRIDPEHPHEELSPPHVAA